MATAINPNTNERLRWDGAKWVPDTPAAAQAAKREKLAGEMQHRDSIPSHQPWEVNPYHPLHDMNFAERAAAGFGAALDQTSRGVRELLAVPTGGAVSPQRAGSLVTDTERAMAARFPAEQLPLQAISPEQSAEARRIDEPLLSTGGGFTGNILGHGAQMGLLGRVAGLPQKVSEAARQAAAYGAMQPGTPLERSVMAGTAAAGGAAGQGLGRLMSSGPGVASQFHRGVNKRAIELGAKVSPGRISRSPALLRKEAGVPHAVRIDQMRAHNQSLLNKHAAKAFGEEADELTPDLLESARVRIGNSIAEAMRGEQIDVGPPFLRKVGQVLTRYGKTIQGRGDSKVRSVKSWLDDLPGTLDADGYAAARSELSKAVHAAYTGANPNPQMGKALEDVIDVLDDAARQALPAEKVAQYATARRQWGNLVTVEKNLVRPDATDLSGPKMASYLIKNRRKAYRTGSGATPEERDLYDLVKFASQSRDIVGDSGTGQRAAPLLRDLAGLGRMGVAGGGTLAVTGDPVTAAVAAGTVNPLFAGAKALGRGAYYSNPVTKAFGYGGVSPAMRPAVEALPRGLLGGAGVTSPLLALPYLPQK